METDRERTSSFCANRHPPTRNKSPLRWVGGQSRVAERIVLHLPPHRTYIETCCGAASVFWAKPRDWSAGEVLNDLDGELINFYRVLHKSGRRLANEVDSMPYSRRAFMECLRAAPSSQFQRAARFWYVNRVGFGGKREHCSFGVQKTRAAWVLPHRILHCLDGVIERLRGVLFEDLDFEHVMKLYDSRNTLFYVAPPYLGTFQGYARRFTTEDQERLARMLKETQGPWVLSCNMSAFARPLYRGYYTMRLRTRYTIGCNSATNASCDAVELLASNRPLKRRATS